MRATRVQRIIELCLLAAAIAAPFFVSDFTLFQLGQALCFGMGVLGLKLLTGYNGQFSIGHSVFFISGAYSSAVLVDNGFDFYASLPLAALISFAIGYAIGWPALRIRAHQLAVVTLVLALAVPQSVRSSALAPLTNGPNGIGISRPAIPIDGIQPDLWWYGVFLTIAVVLAVLSELFVRSRLGRSIQAARDHPTAATSVGIDIRFTNTLSFGLSATFAGLGGGLMMGTLGYVGPDSFTLTLGFSLFVVVLVTGPRWIAGSFVGGLILVFLPNWAEDIAFDFASTQSLTWTVYGAALLLIVYAQTPKGVRLLRSVASAASPWTREKRSSKTALGSGRPR